MIIPNDELSLLAEKITYWFNRSAYEERIGQLDAAERTKNFALGMVQAVDELDSSAYDRITPLLPEELR